MHFDAECVLQAIFMHFDADHLTLNVPAGQPRQLTLNVPAALPPGQSSPVDAECARGASSRPVLAS